MILVIADDLTGAAELAGIGLRYGLTTEVRMEVPASTEAGLLVIATDTRSMDPVSAVAAMETVTKQAMRLQPRWIYKKTDSVLRGHVAGEIRAQMEVLGRHRCLLAPANPALGRTIQEGKYFFKGLPVHQSSFSTDPEYPVVSSSVKDMLHAEASVLPIRSTLPDRGIIVGEVRENKDLYHWAGYVDPVTLPAGAAGFFEALLAREDRQRNSADQAEPMGKPILFVSGTAFRKTAFATGSTAQEIIRQLHEQGIAAVAADGSPGEGPHVVKERMAKLVAGVLSQTDVAELVIEGGATAYAILREAGMDRFSPVGELAPGVVRMNAGSLHITVKPGSYPWPEKINILPI